MKTLKLEVIISSIIALIFGGLSFFTERFFRNGEPQQIFTYYSSKVLLVIFVFFVALFLWRFVSRYRNKENRFYRLWGKYLLYFMIPYLLFLIVVWPGIFIWDEFWVYECATKFMLDNWQSYLSVYHYLISLYIFPSMGSIVLLQVLFMSFVSSWVFTKIQTEFEVETRWKWVYWCFYAVYMLSPAITIYVYVTFRSSPLAILELWLSGLLFFSLKETKISNGTLCLIAFLTLILSVWRQEGIYHLVVVPLFLLVFVRSLNKRKIIYFSMALVIGYLVTVPLYSTLANQKSISLRYQLTTYMNPLSNILVNKDAKIEASSLEVIDKVIDIEKVKASAYIYEVPSYWNGGVRDGFTQTQFNDFKKEFWRIVLDNKDIYLATRVQTMLAASGLSMKGYLPSDSVTSFFNDKQGAAEMVAVALQRELNQPIHLSLRTISNHFLEFSLEHRAVLWNFIPLVLLLLLIFIRKAHIYSPLSWVLALLLLRLPILFVFEPGSYYMYYYPMIPAGAFFILIYVLQLAVRDRGIIQRT